MEKFETKRELIAAYTKGEITVEDFNYHGYELGMSFSEIMETVENKADTFLNKDLMAGFNDAASGYYDKWYRYNRRDDGAAYDKGFKFGKEKFDKEIIIIECKG